MKDTIFEAKQETARENITFEFQPNNHYNAIKSAIIKRHQRNTIVVSKEQHHVGGLPSPPVEEKKVTPEPIVKVEEPYVTISHHMSSNEIREKLKELTEEKHKLFQLLKQLMTEEQQKKEKERQDSKRLSSNQRKKSRWAPQQQESNSSLPPSPSFYNDNNSSYFYARLPPISRYNPYSNQQRQQQQQQHHYPMTRPPYSR